MATEKNPPFLHTVHTLIRKRKTTRHFSEDKIKDRDLLKILEAGRWAPSSLNIQPWHFIVVKDKRTISQIINSCYYGTSASIPPVLVAIVLEKAAKPSAELLEHYQERFMPYLNSVNIGMPALNMVYQALALGIDSGIKSPTTNAVNDLLRVPPGLACRLIVTLGKRHGNSDDIFRHRKHFENIVHLEQFGSPWQHAN